MKLIPTVSTKIGIAAIVSAVGLALPAFADVIDFESQPAGPSLYVEASPIPQTIVTDNTTFTGGVILTDTSALPADETTVYGTTDLVGGGMTNPIVVTNPDGFNNFFFNLLNGLTTPTSFEVADNEGHSQIFDNIASNLDGGDVLVGFASTGTQVTISDISGGNWDFFIDNIHFDEALPPSLGGSVPDGASTAGLLAAGLAGLVAISYRRRATA
jgi:hypothetical protein